MNTQQIIEQSYEVQTKKRAALEALTDLIRVVSGGQDWTAESIEKARKIERYRELIKKVVES